MTLDVPAGADYDLYVWRNCMAPFASSTNSGSADETVIVFDEEDNGSDDSFDYWVEVRYFTGNSCTNWTLTFQGHNC